MSTDQATTKDYTEQAAEMSVLGLTNQETTNKSSDKADETSLLTSSIQVQDFAFGSPSSPSRSTTLYERMSNQLGSVFKSGKNHPTLSESDFERQSRWKTTLADYHRFKENGSEREQKAALTSLKQQHREMREVYVYLTGLMMSEKRKHSRRPRPLLTILSEALEPGFELVEAVKENREFEKRLSWHDEEFEALFYQSGVGEEFATRMRKARKYEAAEAAEKAKEAKEAEEAV